ncbi:virulence factor SrfB [bacterium]|nr:virulence factor SrfB [bacterium]
MVVQLLEGKGIQFICESDVSLADGDRNVLAHREFFCLPKNHTKNEDVEQFEPHLITPDSGSTQCGQFYDTGKHPITGEQLFEIHGEKVLESLSFKWLPIPFTGRIIKDGIQEVDCNNWVRLWINMKTATSADFILCVDTETSTGQTNGDFTGFPKEHLNHAFTISPLSPAFWRSAPLKKSVKKICANISSSHEKDVYPEYSHYIALLQILSKYDLLPQIELRKPMGEPYDAHLFLDIGNSRTCGVIAETREGQRSLNPKNFEKLAIRNLYRPFIVHSEPFDTFCAFMPSPFDSEFFQGTDWSPNFRIPSIMRIGDTVKEMLNNARHGDKPGGPSTLSSPKRYLWANDLQPDPWFFAVPNKDKGHSVIKGDILNHMDEHGYAISGAAGDIPLHPCYPKSAMMTFFILEVLFHAYSQINSCDYRSNKENPLAQRVLKSIVIVTPNGMVEAERSQYEKRAKTAIKLFWQYYDIKTPIPSVSFGFDEASCAQFVYLYSIVKEKLSGQGRLAFEVLGKPRKPRSMRFGPSKENSKSIRLASIDIGGGTSDLMITQYEDVSRGEAPSIKSIPICREGFSVAGDEIVRNIIRDLIFPLLLKATENQGLVKKEHLQKIFGSAPFDSSPQFTWKRNELLDQVFIQIAHKFLEHASSLEGEDIRQFEFEELFKRLPFEHVLDFFTTTISRLLETSDPFYIDLRAIDWCVSRNEVNKVVSRTLSQTLRILSEVIVRYDCDLVILAGKLSALPIVEELLVRLCPVPPSRIFSLTNFEVGPWYPFDTEIDRIKDAKTTVSVGSALWYFAESKAISQFSMSLDRSIIQAVEPFIGEMVVKQKIVPNSALLFPSSRSVDKCLYLDARTYLGSRFIDCEIGHANILYEISFNGNGDFVFPLRVALQQDPHDKSLIRTRRANDFRGRVVNPGKIEIKLRTMEDDLYWLDAGKIW